MTRVITLWRRLSELIEPRRRYWRWKWLILSLAIILAILVPIIALTGTGNTTSGYSSNFATSTYTLCQACHGTGEVAYVPEERRVVTEAKQGILPLKEERDRHKELLNEWKKSVVREGQRTYVASDGQEYNMSLTGTCLACHSIKAEANQAEANQAEFCARCHSYTAVQIAVQPKCMDCHNLSDLKAINNR